MQLLAQIVFGVLFAVGMHLMVRNRGALKLGAALCAPLAIYFFVVFWTRFP